MKNFSLLELINLCKIMQNQIHLNHASITPTHIRHQLNLLFLASIWILLSKHTFSFEIENECEFHSISIVFYSERNVNSKIILLIIIT